MKTSFLLKIVAFGLLIFNWEYVFSHYNDLPERIAVHFNIDGAPDRFASKKTIWQLPVIASLIFGFLFYLRKNPKSPLLNLPAAVRNNPVWVQLIVDGMNILVMALFATITYDSIDVSRNVIETLSPLTVVLIIALLVFVLAIVLVAGKQKKMLDKSC